MFCQYCGSQAKEGSNNCTNCGAPLVAEQTTQQNEQVNYGAPQPPVNQMYGGYQQSYTNYQSQIKPAKKMNIFALIAAAVLAIGMFVPYVSLEGFAEVSLIDGSDGILFLVLAALGILGALIKKNVIVIIAGALASVFAIIKYGQFDETPFAEYYTKGLGFYFMIIGSVLLLISGFIKQKK